MQEKYRWFPACTTLRPEANEVMSFVRRYSVIALVALFAAGCGSAGVGGGISLEQEWQLGNQMAAQVAQQMQLSNDQTALAYVRQLGERIHAQTPQANLPYTFHIVNDPNVNAFSLPGGHIYVNSGLIAQADHSDMLASVLAHEIAHVTARHVVKQIQQQQEISVIGSILLGQNPGALQTIVAQILAGGVMARFSRDDEREADRLGLDYMTAAGYNPNGMVDMFQKLLALERSRPGSVERFFSDHPGTDERIRDISSRIQKMNLRSGLITDDPGYQSIRSRF